MAVLRLAHGKANALDVELLEALIARVRDIEAEGRQAIVLTADGPIFSAGVDLFRVLDGGEAYLDRFLPLLDQVLQALFWCARPVVGAINGHAIAGGCVMAGACDHRIMADGDATIGVPELRVQVPFPSAAIEILRFAAARAHFQELIYFGRTYSVTEACERGLLDDVAPPDELLPRAVNVAERLNAIPASGFWLTKQQLRQSTRERMLSASDASRDEVTALWKSPETLAAIRRYVAQRFGSRGPGTGT